MTDCDEITPDQVYTWHPVRMHHLNDRQLHNMIMWLEEQEGGRFYWTLSKNFWFEREQDLMFCVMSWGA